ncbi:MAG: energy transducer TonB [Chthoniobacteraceae bacterium]|nr:energy transducer TonB [Chthoniobacteraceae bacterium]
MSRHDSFEDEESEKTFLERHRIVLSAVAVIVIAATVILLRQKFSTHGSARQKGPEIVSVRLPPPPPTPPQAAPTPPPQEMKQEQKIVEQAPVNDQEERPKDEPPPAAPLATGIKGNGPPDGFGVGAGGGNVIGGSGSARQNSKWGWYAGQVQTAIAGALRKETALRNASLSLKVRIWPDVTGRVTRAKLAGSTNDPKLDAAVNAALTGLQLKEPPPEGMPLPIVLHITAQRP